MFDMLKTLQKYLLNNATIAQHCKGRIRAYTYDETADRSNHYILIDPLVSPQPETYASDTNLTTEYLYQIDVRGLTTMWLNFYKKKFVKPYGQLALDKSMELMNITTSINCIWMRDVIVETHIQSMN